MVRMCLLVPLSLHLVKGSRVTRGRYYHLFYGLSIVAFSIQLICLLLHEHKHQQNIKTHQFYNNIPVNTESSLRWMVVLSLVSVSCQWIMMAHLRTTAPHHEHNKQKALQSASGRDVQHKKRLAYVYRRLLLQSDCKSPPATSPLNRNPTRKRHGVTMLKRDTNGNSVEEFLSELQTRFENARIAWTAKLDQVIAKQQHLNRPNTHIHTLKMKASHSTTFRLLLQLFAYKEVLTNGKLDRAYERDNGASLLFYLPQLLTFLLHGAYLNADKLEQFLLEKCSRNLLFCHTCFWFLRAWQQPCSTQQDELVSNPPGLKRILSAGGGSPSSTLSHLGSDITLHRRLLHSHHQRTISQDSRQSMLSSTSSRPRLVSDVHHLSPSRSTSMLLFPMSLEIAMDDDKDEDSIIIRHLMDRLVEAGSHVIKQLSGRALETVPSIEMDIDEEYGLNQPYIESPHNILDETSNFFSTPKFLDSLLQLADHLLTVQIREERTKHLRQHLEFICQEHLHKHSSNPYLYVPIGDPHHQIQNIVVEECVALSTKERVPCIIYLEVIDNASINYAIDDEYCQIRAWVDTPRYPPDRLKNSPSSFLNKISKNIDQGFRRLKNDLLSSKHNVKADETLPILGSSGNTEIEDEENSDLYSCYSSCSSSTDAVLDHKDTSDDSIDAFFDANSSPIDSGYSEQIPSMEIDYPRTPFQPRKSSMGQWSSPRPNVPQSSHQLSSKAHQCDDRVLIPSAQPASLSDKISAILSPASYRHVVSVPTQPKNEHSTETESKVVNSAVFVPSPSSTIKTAGTDLKSYGTATQEQRRNEEPSTSDIQSAQEALFNYDGDITKPTQPEPYSKSKLLAFNLANQIVAPSTHIYTSHGDDFRIKNIDTPLAQVPPSPPHQSHSTAPPLVFKENWKAKQERIRAQSQWGKHPGWRLLPILIKSNDDLRQEQLASQIIHRMAAILSRRKVPVWLYPYDILALTRRGGMMEAITDTISLDSLKRNDPNFTNLQDFFLRHFGAADTPAYQQAQANFVESLAAYSIVCYLLQLKDRHNGNILLDNQGHLIHIDFGFYFLSSPGKNAGFESAPFKLTRDYVKLMEYPSSRIFLRFRELCVKTFLELRRHCEELILLVEMIAEGNADLPCFRHGETDTALKELRERFQLHLNDRACIDYVNSLVDESLENWRTRWYDRYQRYCVGVL